jgi:dTDP-4-amino-4,6-dideoxygalactose transaminase
MQFIDLAAQQKQIRAQIETNIQQVLDHGKYILGPEVAELEEKLANFCEVKHGLACASGTDALLLALLAHGIGPGDAVLTTPFTFIATAEVIRLIGAVPVFVDIDAGDFNMSPSKLEQAIIAVKNVDDHLHPLPQIKELDGIKPKAVIAVDLFGLPADYDQINAIAEKHGLIVIEDAAQSFGARYKNKAACGLADIACTSFFPAKPLGAYGDGGMCFTNSDTLAEKIQSLRVHGKGTHKYDNIRIGINGRLDTLQAAILLAKFDIFKEEVRLRRQIADRYTQLLKESDLVVPIEPEGYESVWAQYSLLATDEDARGALQAHLKAAGIPTAVYYPLPLHLQTAFNDLGYIEGAFPVSEDCSKRIFSLPMHPYLTKAQQEGIATAILGI